MSRRYEAVIDGREVRCFQDWNDQHWVMRDDLVSDEADQDAATVLEEPEVSGTPTGWQPDDEWLTANDLDT